MISPKRFETVTLNNCEWPEKLFHELDTGQFSDPSKQLITESSEPIRQRLSDFISLSFHEPLHGICSLDLAISTTKRTSPATDFLRSIHLHVKMKQNASFFLYAKQWEIIWDEYQC